VSDRPRLTRREALTAGLAAGAAALALRPSPAADDPGKALPLIMRPIPTSGERLPVIGVGTNKYGVSSPDEVAARRAVLARLPELGGSVVDTAPIYGLSESLIGEQVASIGNRDRLFLASKVMASDADAAKASFEETLRRLKVPRIDLLQVHNLVGVDSVLPLLQEWKKTGKIRYYGVTTSSPGQHARMLEIMRRQPLDFIQVDYSIGNRLAADAVLPAAQERGIAVLLNEPLGGRRGGNALTQVAGRMLPEWAADIDARSWAQFFLKYAISHPAVTCAIPGTTSVAHLEDNQLGGRGRVPDAALRKRMEQFWDSKA